MFTFKKRHQALYPVLAVGLTLLSACGSSTGSGESTAAENSSVASLVTPDPDRATPTPTAAERPLIRPDTSEAELTRMFKVYYACMRDNGLPESLFKMYSQANGMDVDTANKYRKQCGSKQPQPLFDSARESDPEFADHLRAEAKCLNDHGVPVQITKDGGIAGDGLPSGSKAHWLDDCEQQAFADYYKTLS